MRNCKFLAQQATTFLYRFKHADTSFDSAPIKIFTTATVLKISNGSSFGCIGTQTSRKNNRRKISPEVVKTK
jgi:hypothetical protein